MSAVVEAAGASEEKGEAEDKVSPPGGTPPGEDDPGSEQASQTVRSSMP